MANYDQHLLVKVAELYYKQGYKQKQIADKLKMSRSKVSRVIDEARRRHLVEIKINYSRTDNIKLENRFEREFDLKEAVIISTDSPEQLALNQVSKKAGDYLLQKLKKSDTLGISWGKTLNNIARSVQPCKKNIEIIQILGDIGASVSSNSIVQRLSEKLNCDYTLLPAPAIVDNAGIKQALLSDSNIKNVLDKFREISIALVGIGDISQKSSFYQSGYLDLDNLEQLQARGAAGDICGRFLKIDGQPVNSEMDVRIIGIELEQLRKIPYVIGVAAGERKNRAILSALNSQVIDILITDEKTASSIMEI